MEDAPCMRTNIKSDIINIRDAIQLHSLARKGCITSIIRLFNRGASVNSTDTHKRTPLHYAARAGHLDIVKFLIKENASVNAADKHGITSLMLSAREGHAEVVELLVKSGAVLEASDRKGYTALHEGAYAGHKLVVDFLLKAGAPTEAKDITDGTPLHACAYRGHTDIVEMLVSDGACVSAVDSYGQTPLHKSVMRGHTDIVKLLVQRKAPLDIKDRFGCTPLQTAHRAGYLDAVACWLTQWTKQDRSCQPHRGKEGVVSDHITACQGCGDSSSCHCQTASSSTSNTQVLITSSSPHFQPVMNESAFGTTSNYTSNTSQSLRVEKVNSALAVPMGEAIGKVLQELSPGELTHSSKQTVNGIENGSINLTVVVNYTVQNDKMVVHNMHNVSSEQVKIDHVQNMATGGSSINIYHCTCHHSEDNDSTSSQ